MIFIESRLDPIHIGQIKKKKKYSLMLHLCACFISVYITIGIKLGWLYILRAHYSTRPMVPIYKMVTQNMLRTHEGKYVFSNEKYPICHYSRSNQMP